MSRTHLQRERKKSVFVFEVGWVGGWRLFVQFDIHTCRVYGCLLACCISGQADSNFFLSSSFRSFPFLYAPSLFALARPRQCRSGMCNAQQYGADSNGIIELGPEAEEEN
mmetsp:Transcript_21630/g.56165  ORF Transcript_21630/g.56165 Transcript_21630/m.56165 type:complete len:110 (+) Transcript_21630:80-409(+)